MDDDWDLDDGWDDGIEYFPDDDPSSPDEGPGEWLRELTLLPDTRPNEVPGE